LAIPFNYSFFGGQQKIEPLLKILHLIYTNGISGAEKYLQDLLPSLTDLGIHCELICICPKKNSISLSEYCRKMEEKGVKSTLLTTSSKISYLKIAGEIAAYLKSNNIGAIHAHLFSADLISVLIKKLFIKKLVIFSTKHGYEEKYLVQYGLGNKQVPGNPYYYITRYLISNIDHNITVSKALSRLYAHIRLVKEEMPFIHHGINFQPSPGKDTQLKGDPKILMVGRLSTIKGHSYLIKALPEILKKFPALTLILAGEGPLKEDLVKLSTLLNVNDHINFVGYAKPEDYSPQCQLMILPSLFESFGLVYIESFSLKIPLVAFDSEAGNEIIDNNQTGILVPKGDVKSLAEKIIYLLETPGERERIAENAYKKYRSYFNAERMAKETAAWYQKSLPINF
jgi:glycosyltransferase involved in cell wall biosynthesis